MNITIFCNQYYTKGGTESFLASIVTANLEMGHKVKIVSLGEDDAVAPTKADNQNISFIGCGMSQLRFIFEALKAHFKSSLIVYGNPGLSILALFQYLAFRRNSIAIVHGTEAWHKMPLRHRIGLNAVRRILATTPYNSQTVSENNSISIDKFSILPIAIERRHGVEQKESFEIKNGICQFLFVGRMNEAEAYKGIDEILEAISSSQELRNLTYLNVVGGGDDLNRLKSKAVDLGLDSCTTFWGIIDDDRLSELYSKNDVFIMPSEKEGFGVVFLEAMRFSLPCIGGNSGGTPFVLQNNITGFLVSRHDREMITTAMLRLATSEETRKLFGQAGYDRVTNTFSFETFKSQLKSIQDLL